MLGQGLPPIGRLSSEQRRVSYFKDAKTCLPEALLSTCLPKKLHSAQEVRLPFPQKASLPPLPVLLCPCSLHGSWKADMVIHWTSYPAGDPNTPWGCPGMHTILLLKTLVLSRRLNIFLKCNRPFLKEPRARRDTWSHLIPCLWDEEVRPRKTWHKCLSNHRRALELSHMVSQTSQSQFWTPRTVMILPSQCVRLNVRSLGCIPAQL